MSVARHCPRRLRRLTVQRYILFLNPQNFYDTTRATLRFCCSTHCCRHKEKKKLTLDYLSVFFRLQRYKNGAPHRDTPKLFFTMRETLKPTGQTFRLLLSQSIIFQFHFPKNFGKILIVSMLRNEHLAILSSLKSYRKLYKPRRMRNLNE